ncbi:glycosyltransferase [Vibrio fluvialis]|nr:glycosyltransferase [Vibrio fluvialis]
MGKLTSNHQVVFVAFSNYKGGAAIACNRLYNLLLKKSNLLDMTMLMSTKPIEGVGKGIKTMSLLDRLINFSLRLIEHSLIKILWYHDDNKRSLNLFGVNSFFKELRFGSLDVIHIHWINNNVLSIYHLDKLVRSGTRTVITLHDEWLFSSSEHVTNDAIIDNRIYFFKVIAGKIDSIIKKKKRDILRNAVNTSIIVPSLWVKNKLISNASVNPESVFVIPNPVPFEYFHPINNVYSSNNFTIVIPKFKRSNKGYTLACQAVNEFYLSLCVERRRKVEIITFGENFEDDLEVPDKQVFHQGYVSCLEQLNEIYNLADVTLVASLMESFGQVAAESTCSGTPVLCFNTSGHRDTVKEGINGYLVECYNVSKLTEGLERFFYMKDNEKNELRKSCLSFAQSNFSDDKIVRETINLYSKNEL